MSHYHTYWKIPEDFQIINKTSIPTMSLLFYIILKSLGNEIKHETEISRIVSWKEEKDY